MCDVQVFVNVGDGILAGTSQIVQMHSEFLKDPEIIISNCSAGNTLNKLPINSLHI